MVVRETPAVPQRVKYYSFQELCADTTKLKDPWVTLRRQEQFLAVGRIDHNLDVELKVIFEDSSFSPCIKRYNNQLMKRFNVEMSGLHALLRELDLMEWCHGSPTATMCSVALESGESVICKACYDLQEKRKKKADRVIKPNTPLSTATHAALIHEVKSCRQQVKEKDAALAAIQRQIEHESVSLSPDIHNGLQTVVDAADIADPFVKLFWEEQQKAMHRNPKGMRWHPMMIRFAIYLHFQSPRAYEALRSSGVLCLPNKSTLLDYTRFFEAKEGFQPHVFQDIKRRLQTMPENKHYGIIMHDEMSVRGDLVYDRRNDKIVGFVNSDSWRFDGKNAGPKIVASHVLVFMAVGLHNDIKASIGYFATTNATADFLYRKLWKAVAYLENSSFKVIASTSDKASSNQRLARLHGEECHVTENLYASEKRPFYFISDPPHLMKTIRNNLEGSTLKCGRRRLWKNEKDILWRHICIVSENDSMGHLRKTKLRKEHIQLTPSSRMSVRLAVQVLSKRVGHALADVGPEAEETAKFVLLCDRFFDCLNGKSAEAHLASKKPELAPYASSSDERFQFLEEFLSYLDEWRGEIDERPGFSKSEKDKMFLSHQTYEGIQTTVKGFTGAVKYLLDHDVKAISSNVFCQDALENHFGRHRGLGY